MGLDGREGPEGREGRWRAGKVGKVGKGPQPTTCATNLRRPRPKFPAAQAST